MLRSWFLLWDFHFADVNTAKLHENLTTPSIYAKELLPKILQFAHVLFYSALLS